MTNEIKEILENVRKCCEITTDQSFVVYQRQDILKVLDYITNLQNKLEEKTYLYNKLDTESKYAITNLQERIDKAIHILKHIPKIQISDFDDRVEKAYKVLQGEDK